MLLPSIYILNLGVKEISQGAGRCSAVRYSRLDFRSDCWKVVRQTAMQAPPMTRIATVWNLNNVHARWVLLLDAQVIKGWTEAMQLMKEGDHWELFIPSGDVTHPPSFFFSFRTSTVSRSFSNRIVAVSHSFHCERLEGVSAACSRLDYTGRGGGGLRLGGACRSLSAWQTAIYAGRPLHIARA